jgi:hypothetical protein
MPRAWLDGQEELVGVLCILKLLSGPNAELLGNVEKVVQDLSAAAPSPEDIDSANR